MVFLPMVERELRGSARKRSSYGTRFATALASLLVAAWLWLMMHGQPDRVIGQILFYSVSVVAFFQTLVVGLVGAADCLSEEKREGTLGLLFLTDLKGFDVVLGKLAASSCTALYATLAIFPVLALPILLGGVTGLEFARVVLVATNNLFLSLAVAILCSSLSRNERKARGATLVILLFLAVGIPFLVEIAAEYPGHTWKGWYFVFLLPSPGFACYGAFDPVARLMGPSQPGRTRVALLGFGSRHSRRGLAGAPRRLLDPAAHLAGSSVGAAQRKLARTDGSMEIRGSSGPSPASDPTSGNESPSLAHQPG